MIPPTRKRGAAAGGEEGKEALSSSGAPAPVSDRSKAILQATALITLLSLGVKGLGFLEKLLLAYFFGTGVEIDAYLVAYGLPFSAFIVLREVVKPAFLPPFLRTWRASQEDGRRLFRTSGTVLAILLGIVSVAGVALADPIISLAAPGFEGEQRALAVQLVRLASPALFLLGLSTLTTAALHAHKRFVLPVFGDASYRLGPLALLLSVGGVQAMMVGAVLGALGKLAIEAAGLRKQLGRLRPALDLTLAPVRTVGRLAAPLLAATFLSLFIAPIVENAFASQVGVGGVSSLAYARKIVETLTTILPYTLGLVLFPFSAEMAAGGDHKALASTLTSAVRALVLLFLPVTLGLMVLRVPFVQLLFERGAFTAESTQLTAGPLFYYALALLPFALEVIIIPFFFARQDTLTPVLTDVAAFALNVALIPLLMPLVGLGGIALAAALAKGAKVLALLVLFSRRVPDFRLAPLKPFSLQMLAASLATVGTLALFSSLGPGWGDGMVALTLYLSAGALLGIAVFFGSAYLLRVGELRDLTARGQSWLRARRSGS
jgi:murein biosynthesis integral membrane protein MurJ